MVRGDELVAELVVETPDFPWLRARVRPGPALSELRPMFDEEVRLLEAADESRAASRADDAGWEAAYWRIRRAVQLVTPDGREVPEFMLHIDGDEAWWRWEDEPFETSEADTP